MIIKAYELKKINFENNYLFLLHGNNEGHKREIIDSRADRKRGTDVAFFYAAVRANLLGHNASALAFSA